MRVGLFIPCYVNQFYPSVGIASLELLEKCGCQVAYPLGQTCCGQPMANSGYEHLTVACSKNFIQNFEGFDYVVSPSGSCVLHIKEHLHAEGQETSALMIRQKVFEITEFLTDVLQVENITARFPYRVGIHQSCHGQRGLHLASMSERVMPFYSKPEQLLRQVKDIELMDLERPDECCGFGGTFCVFEEAVSARMGKDRAFDHITHGAQYITGADMSCLMHLEGILNRQKSEVQVKHIVEILNAE